MSKNKSKSKKKNGKKKCVGTKNLSEKVWEPIIPIEIARVFSVNVRRVHTAIKTHIDGLRLLHGINEKDLNRCTSEDRGTVEELAKMLAQRDVYITNLHRRNTFERSLYDIATTNGCEVSEKIDDIVRSYANDTEVLEEIQFELKTLCKLLSQFEILTESKVQNSVSDATIAVESKSEPTGCCEPDETKP